ncbi:hypothetical protein QR680_016430 [Steinernema hermaphroditum]|uniref:UDP-glucuronosyltransferase n=1 Tax=Steinernema hermaphroditum TaxID=289476 RepID=A0AA39HB69_9BILA|nr:hypothetical protein QR680_016430 [Steinernema hermaphroditum]
MKVVSTVLCLLTLLFSLSSAYKILVYSQMNGRSQVIYMGAIADILVDAGHDVTVLLNEINPDVTTTGTKKAKTISIPASEDVKAHFKGDEYIAGTWTMDLSNPWVQKEISHAYSRVIAQQCLYVIKHHNAIFDKLKDEKFDLMIHELMDYCQFGIMQAAGIKSHVIVQSTIIYEGVADQLGITTNPSLVPSFYASAGGEMTLRERILNAIQLGIGKEFTNICYREEEEAFRNYLGEKFVPFQDMVDSATYVITNSDPFLDFPRPIISKVLDLGGMCVKQPKPLTKEWKDVLEKRDKAVFISFGGNAKSYVMPHEFKRSFAETFKKFPDVTFIWKYETKETEFLDGVENVYTTQWAPQNDILDHPNMKLFMTHAGMNSVLESAHRGVPIISVPLFADQVRNAKMMTRLGSGIDIDRFDLKSADKLSEAIRKILTNDSYTKTAKHVAYMIKNRPVNQTEMFVKHVEFAAMFGSVPSMTSLATKMSMVEYFMLDAIVLLVLLVGAGVFLFLSSANQMLRVVCRNQAKYKTQ